MSAAFSTDPRLAALYDGDNPDGPDHGYFLRRADRLSAATIVDLGCGTGILTTTLASTGRHVVGVDPDAGMLAVARDRAGHERVDWRLGDSSQIGTPGADLVLMTGNVAQHIGPDDWGRTLDDVAAALRTGGQVNFESRNPSLEAWRSWADGGRLPTTRDTPFGPLTEWTDVSEPDHEGTVVLTCHNHWNDSGDDVVVTLPLTFRTLDQITRDLAGSGLDVIEIEGGWTGEPFDPTSPLMIILAEKL